MRNRTANAGPHICFDRTGSAYYRTRLLKDKARAASFARCVAANSRYQDAEIMASEQGRGWYVRYRPTSKERLDALAAIKQNERYQRALEEKDTWRVKPDWSAEKKDRWIVQTHIGDEKREKQYLVGEDFCTCDDYTMRCKDAAMLCKHGIGIALLIGEGKLTPKSQYARRNKGNDQ